MNIKIYTPWFRVNQEYYAGFRAAVLTGEGCWSISRSGTSYRPSLMHKYFSSFELAAKAYDKFIEKEDKSAYLL